jgi:LacI family transcriptional regulator
VIGVDDLDVAQMIDPELTTINQKTKEQGEAIAEILLNMIETKHKNTPRQIIIEPELIIREST